ncbi:hypothetical protein X975_04294, partial [Stegodyphus mimosarum]
MMTEQPIAIVNTQKYHSEYIGEIVKISANGSCGSSAWNPVSVPFCLSSVLSIVLYSAFHRNQF